jgi:hypothetical protein
MIAHHFCCHWFKSFDFFSIGRGPIISLERYNRLLTL